MLLRAVFSQFFLRVAVPVLLAAAWAASPSHAEESVATNLSDQVRKIFGDHRDAVVKVRSKDKLGIRYGSGFFVDPAGTIYTHADVVLNADEVVAIFGDREFPARVLVADERSGIALLKIDSSTPFIPTGDSSKIGIAAPLIIIGYPENLDAGPSFGIVGGFDRGYLGQFFSTTHIRANIPVQCGQGGAPVLNMDGEAIGILVGRLEGGTACHILPMRAAEKVRNELARFGEVRPGWVGVEVEESGLPVAGSTAKVESLDPEAPAAKSGLRPGDILLKIGETSVASAEDVIDASYFLTAGDQADIVVMRGAEKIAIPVRAGLHPLASGEAMQATAEPDALQKFNLQ